MDIESFKRFLKEKPEEAKALIDIVSEMNLPGPTVKEYFKEIEVMSWNIDNFEKVGWFYIDKRPSQGNGDLIYNTCRMIIETQDKSDWAYESLMECAVCLFFRIRWPSDMAEYITTKTHEQADMTRDPFIAFFAASIYLGKLKYLAIKIPWYLFRPSVSAWRIYLLKGWKMMLWIYKLGKWWNDLLPKKEYVKALDELMDKAIKWGKDGN